VRRMWAEAPVLCGLLDERRTALAACASTVFDRAVASVHFLSMITEGCFAAIEASQRSRVCILSGVHVRLFLIGLS